MLRVRAPKNQRLVGPYHKDCPVCGANLWDNCLPSPYGWIVCTGCGTDWSRNPGFKFRVRYGFYMMQKRARLYGIAKMVRMGIADAFLLPREREAIKRRLERSNRPKELTHV